MNNLNDRKYKKNFFNFQMLERIKEYYRLSLYKSESFRIIYCNM
jgi:hypothetical protein